MGLHDFEPRYQYQKLPLPRVRGTIQRPRFVNVPLKIGRVLRDPNRVTSYQLNTLLFVVNCAQQVLGKNWERRGVDYWRGRESINYIMPTHRLAEWCECSESLLLKRLERFKEPVGSITMDQRTGLFDVPLPPPVISVRPQPGDSTSITLALAWVRLRVLYGRIKLPIPVGNKSRCADYIQEQLAESGM